MITEALKTTLLTSFFGWKKPAHLILHVTNRCNSRCGMCFTWKRLHQKEKELTLEEITNLSKTLGKLVFLDVSGGEPFLREDLDEILDSFNRYCRPSYVNLPTNCLLPEKIEKMTAKILHKTDFPISLNLSLDGLEKTHDQIRGVKGNFVKVVETWKKLKVLKKKNPRLSVKVATVISRQNFSELEKLDGFVRREMQGIDFHTLILVRGKPPNDRFVLPSLAELESKKRLFHLIWRHYEYGKNLGVLGSRMANVSHRYFLDLYLKTLREKRMSLPCLAGRAHAVVFANGDLAFCELRKPIGNLRGANFWQLWQGEEAQRQREKISRNRCFCAHGCNWTDNVFLNPKTYPRLAGLTLKNVFESLL